VADENDNRDGGDSKGAAAGGSPVPVDDFEIPAAAAKEGAPGWITTFADLMSLLMSFFVMLVAMSEIDRTIFKEMVQSMKRELGGAMAPEETSSKEQQKPTDSASKRTAGQKEQSDKTSSIKRLLNEEIAAGKLEVAAGDSTITIRVLQSGSFRPGSARLRGAFMPVIDKLRQALEGIEGAIEVSGHTDNRPIRSRRFRSNWELSVARSYAVAEALKRSETLSRRRMTILGHAHTRPRAPNNTPDNRARNRRVEIVIDEAAVPLVVGRLDVAKGKTRPLVINYENVDSIDIMGVQQQGDEPPPDATSDGGGNDGGDDAPGGSNGDLPGVTVPTHEPADVTLEIDVSGPVPVDGDTDVDGQ